MTAFQFRLARLLRLRESQRDQRQSALAEGLEAQRLLADEQAGLEALLAGLVDDQRRTAEPGPVDVDRLLDTQRYDAVLRVKLAELQARAALVTAEVARRREELLAANREVRVLENLREQQRAAHQAEQERREILQLDEAGAQRHLAREDAPWAS